MKKLFKLFALALPVAFAASCGGDILGDGNLDMDAVCPGNPTLFRFQSTDYTTVGTPVVDPSTTCPGITGTALMGTRRCENNTQTGVITCYATDGTTPLGSGPIQCNAGTLTYGPATLLTGTCQYTSTRTSTVTLTADNTFDFVYTEQRTKFMSSGGACTQVNDCTIKYTMKMNAPVK